ncbi:NrtA/SsuA/CpmA family ABC transporter substrate-binding protein [Methylomonas sp. LL1]|uniref:ABC transporter substrate-binding protein n=1 Tax=Methylomonas sp. LL1 TaxID=2785785 RepID=UPI0018C412C1|nr:NrtA/SsuA/CpmA family ABC transporter substrate-binding protein [Methylomonas sp. LL1]QPK64786.1 NrtA/SsuA/CpmA family ABC transporter substrate-binding protein [Methylomonas sp. LL1]
MNHAVLKRIRTMTVLVLVILFGAGVSGCDKAAERQTVKEKIVIASSPYALTGLVFLAIDQGLFEQQGLDVVVDLKPSGKQSLDAMLEQKAQIALASETPVVKTIMTGKRLAILGSLGESFGDIMLVGNMDHGMAKPEDLRGKAIAVEVGTSSEYFLDATLTNHNITRDQVRIVSISTDKIGEALASGEVDAGVGWQPYVLAWQKQLGDHAYSYSNPHYYTLTWYITASPDYVAGHGETLQKFFHALVEAEHHHQEQPEDMRRVLAERAKISAELYDTNVYRFALRLDQAMLVILESLSHWVMQRGIVPRQAMPNYLDFFATEPLKAVKPEAVTIVR